MDGGYSLKRWPIDKPNPGACRVNLAMYDPLVGLLAVNFEVDLLVVLRRECDVDSLLLGDHDRLRPDYIEQLQDGRFGPRRQCVFDRRPRHLKIRHSGQDFMYGGPIRTYSMIR